MGQELRIKNYELRGGFIFLLLTSYFLLLVFFVASPAFADVSIVPTDCYEQGDYSLGSFLDIAQNIMKFVWSISGAFALLMFFFGGILWLVSAGEDKRVTQGRETMVQAATGLIIVLGSWVFINFVVAALTGSPANTTANIFGNKDWSTYDDGPCLTSYWQRAFPLLSSHAPVVSSSTLTAAGATVTPPKCCFIVEMKSEHVTDLTGMTLSEVENGGWFAVPGSEIKQYNIYEPFKTSAECTALNLQNYSPTTFASTYNKPIYVKHTIVAGTKTWCPKNCPEPTTAKSNWTTGACRN